MNKPDPLWVNGTCDRIMEVLKDWASRYRKGRVSATCKYVTKPGEMGPEPKEIDVPSRRAVDVAWLQGDLDYLTKILEAKVPDWPVTTDMRANFPKWRNGRLVPGGARVVVMDLYLQNLVEIYQLLEAMRDGKTQEAEGTTDLAAVDLTQYI